MTRKFINYTDHQGKTALHYAAFRDQTEIIKILVKNMAIPFLRDHKKRVRILTFKFYQKPFDMTNDP